MKKINRRDYLTGMGAAVGAIAGTAGLEVFAQQPGQVIEPSSKSSHAQQKPVKAESVQRGKADTALQAGASALPPPSVRLVFHGLSAFWIAGNVCKVGFHRSPQHPLTIVAYRKSAFKCVEEKRWDKVNTAFSLSTINPDPDVPKALFYQPGGSDIERPDRDPEDFRWVLDFESKDLYGKTLNKDLQNVYDRQIEVTNAIFYTLKKTASTFAAITPDGSPIPGHTLPIKYLGNVAQVIAANIYLAERGKVTLTVGNEPPVDIPLGEIHFLNPCMDGENKCEFTATAGPKEQRNDFYRHYEAIKLAADPELQLVILERRDATPLQGICSTQQKLAMHTQKLPMHGNDEAPCSGSGFGGGGFPPYPVQ